MKTLSISTPLVGLLLSLVGPPGLYAANIAVYSLDEADPSNSHVILDNEGNPLPVGTGHIAVGTFRTLSDEAIAAAGSISDWLALREDFDQFGAAGNIVNFAGIVTLDASEPVRDNSFLAGKPIYVLIGNAPSGLGASDLWLVYKSNEVFPVDNPISEARVDLTETSGTELVVGSVGNETITLTGTALEQFSPLPTIQLAGEPGVSIGPFVILELDPILIADTIELSWNSRPDVTYAVDFSEDLTLWTEIATGLASGGLTTSFIDDQVPPGTTRRFYRIRQE